MDAKEQQQLIVNGISEFLSRAQLRAELLSPEHFPFKKVYAYMVLGWLRARLSDEIGPNARFRLIDKDDVR